jgi:hypothetical protein
MRSLRHGEETVLSWEAGAVTCRVVAVAGHYVLLQPERPVDPGSTPAGAASLTYLDGMVPMGWDGSVEAGAHSGELRFRAEPGRHAPDRRSSVRVPVLAAVQITSRAHPGGHEGRMLDVSAGGMRLRHGLKLAVGDLLRVRCMLPDGMLVDADAVVRGTEVGIAEVEFTAMHGTDAATIGRWTVEVLRSSMHGRG